MYNIILYNVHVRYRSDHQHIDHEEIPGCRDASEGEFEVTGELFSLWWGTDNEDQPFLVETFVGNSVESARESMTFLGSLEHSPDEGVAVYVDTPSERGVLDF